MDNLSFVIAAGGLIVALAGVIVGPVVTWKVATARNRHERKQADESRRQQRLETVYVDLIQHELLLLDYIDRTEPFMHTVNDPGPPAMPSDADFRRLSARVRAFGSPEVWERLNAIDTAARAFAVDVARVQDERLGRAKDEGHSRQDLEEHRKAFRQAVNGLVDQIRQELGAAAESPQRAGTP